ncbi:hypothetical protein TSOC_009291 [Tetrabaena socialis]|uniref:Transmembrane protein n=1 Tax=Tetrabaena socialis TaxID=47790 RepID=A0A2J7ZWB5_9CHLO|nr:hypothetical protein TSOC_009291 [Tetrabaena socialis]|eukprot:PNH04542.1 hypothetical protein TSOC_009291 [Tetrabaena socialis]
MTEGGSWIGHFLPGVVLGIWGIWTMQGVFRNFFNSRRIKAQYLSQATYTLWRFPARSESVCKLLLPVLAMSLELYFAHLGGWRSVLCPAGTARAGRFYGPHCFLYLALLCKSLLMWLHKKHAPLDSMVHSILLYTMVSTAAFALAEAVHPRSFLLSCGRVASMLIQSAWFFAATSIMFERHTAWDEEDGNDMAPVMMAPVVFMASIVVISAAMFAAFLAFHAFHNNVKGTRGCSYEQAGLLDADSHSAARTSPPNARDTNCHV